MKALDRKLWRDLWMMKGQAFAIALVIVSGVSTFVMLVSTMQSLNMTRSRFYREYGFADVFASLKRAPESLKTRIGEIPGADRVETRVVADVKLDIKGYPEPVTAKLVSVPDSGKPLLNRLYMRKGRMVDPWKDNEVVVSEAFADAHGFSPGDSFGAVINGKWKTLVITGVALSPEFVLQVRPGAISPDFKRYAILWMGRNALGKAYDMEGAFNNLVLTLSEDAAIEDFLVRLDNILNRYGGLGSYGRKDQMSHRYLTEEFRQLERSAEIYPVIFMAVAAFLLNVVISRTISTQREQIAALKAFGYSNMDIGMHYVKLVILIVLIGVAGGFAAGAWLGKGLGNIYMEFYRFPYLMYELQPSVVLTAAFVAISAALAGTVYSVWKAAVMLTPAEAMRPEPPARYRKTVIERIGLGRFLSQPTRIIVRNIERRPIRALLSVTGISLACAIMIAGGFFQDAVDFMVDVQFRLSQKEDMSVTFIEPTSRKALYELKSIRGVEHAEVFRSVPVRLKFEHNSYRTSIKGIETGNRLHFLLNTKLEQIDLPPSGIVLTDYLGNILGVRPGDMLTVEVLEGARPVLQVPVVGLVSQYIGLMGYMDLEALNRLMSEGNAVSGAYMTTDSLYQQEIYRRLVEMPRVAGTVVRKDEIRNFYETQAEYLLFFTFVATILAGTIALGVVYNSARIALAERNRELASLRVLGYTRAEISYIFLGELGLLALAAIPLGFIIGRGMCAYIARALESDLFRIPVVIGHGTYSLAATVVIVSACLSGLIVRHRLDHLDLVAVLKTKE
ncbi:MAG: FtsX-like permease family protein [Nitrospirota bacterium]